MNEDLAKLAYQFANLIDDKEIDKQWHDLDNRERWLDFAEVALPLISAEARKQERERLGDKLRAWLVSSISDGELAKEFQISDYDWNILFQDKQATFNSYCGSLIEECDYPLCKARQALKEGSKEADNG